MSRLSIGPTIAHETVKLNAIRAPVSVSPRHKPVNFLAVKCSIAGLSAFREVKPFRICPPASPGPGGGDRPLPSCLTLCPGLHLCLPGARPCRRPRTCTASSWPCPCGSIRGTGALISQIGEQRRIPVTYEEIPRLVVEGRAGRRGRPVLRAPRLRLDGGAARRGDERGHGRAPARAPAPSPSRPRATCSCPWTRPPRRKLSEVFVTYRMERDFTKEQILATYLNVVPFGQRAYGIAAAAETYYGKRLDELTVAQAATLAGIIQRPSRQNPVTDPKAAAARRGYVLRRMREAGVHRRGDRRRGCRGAFGHASLRAAVGRGGPLRGRDGRGRRSCVAMARPR